MLDPQRSFSPAASLAAPSAIRLPGPRALPTPSPAGQTPSPQAEGAFLRDLRQISVDRVVKSDQIVIAEASDSDTVGFVLSGVLRVARTFPDGGTKTVGFVFPGGFFGRLFTRSAFSYEAAAMTRLRCARRPDFERILANHPSIGQRFFLKALDDLDQSRQWFLDLQRKTVVERLAMFLRLVARASGEGQLRRGQNLRLPVSRQDTALYLGTTRESICRGLRQLTDCGALRLRAPSRIEILDAERLEEIAGDGFEATDLLQINDADFFPAGRMDRLG
jgi:CRP/FNR family nitrogen fixation transcriptional regulator